MLRFHGTRLHDGPVKNPSVLISGIGIAGPTLAYWLSRNGFKPTLVERAPKLRAGGYVIDFWGLGFDIAERMGLVPDLRREGYDVGEVRFVDGGGRREGGFKVGIFKTLTGGRYVSIARSDLGKLIYRKIESDCECVFGDSIAGIEQVTDGVHVTFEKGSPRRFDLVIGADGLHSAVRHSVFGGQDRFEKYLGYMVAAFETKGYRPRDELVYVSHCVPGKHVSRFAMHNDRTLFLFVFAADQAPKAGPHDINAHKKILRAQFGDAGWECQKILAEMDRCDDLYFDRVSQIRMDSWSRGRVALLGDAAFCPSLLAGQGSALAMAAAYVLAGELARAQGDYQTAFLRYQTMLKPMLDMKQKAAPGFAGFLAPKTRAGLFLRNQLSKAFRIPAVARWAFSRGLFDPLELPDYGMR